MMKDEGIIIGFRCIDDHFGDNAQFCNVNAKRTTAARSGKDDIIHQ